MKARLLPSRSKGFTLIEVLVVIAIIALLVIKKNAEKKAAVN